MLRFLLLLQIFYTVYQGHYTFETGVPGVNLPNFLFLVTFLLIVLTGRRDEIVDSAFLRRPIFGFFAMLMLAFAIAQVRAPGDFMVDVTYLRNAMFSPLLYFMYLHSKQNLKNTRLLVIAIMVVAAVAAVQAIRQGLDYGIGNFEESHRAAGPFGGNYQGANRAGVYYAMFLPMFIALALFLRKNLLWRVTAMVGVCLLTMALMLTYSRQSYFIGLLGLVLLLLRRNVVAAVVIGIALVSLSGYLPVSVTERVAQTQQTGPHGEEQVDVSTASRWVIWAGAMDMWRDNPVGVGLNRFKNEIGNFSSFKHFDAHNFYVLTLAECGPQGLLALFVLIAALMRLGLFLGRNAPPDDPEARALAVGFSVMTVCMALGNFYGSPFLEGNVMGTYWALCGVLERYMHLKSAAAVPDATTLPAQVAMAERFPLAARSRSLPVRLP